MSPRKCTVEGCERPHNARGYCRTHYGRMIEGKSPLRAVTDKAAFDAARLEDLHFMAQTGESLNGAARRLGISERGLELWLTRHQAEALTAVLRSRNPRDPNASANAPAVWVKPAKAKHRARVRAARAAARADGAA